MHEYLSIKEVNELRQLRVIRADTNSLYQRMVETYIEMKGEVRSLEETISDQEMEIDDLSIINDDLQEELDHVRELQEKTSSQNAKLIRASKAYINVLKAEELISKDTTIEFDASI